MSRPSGHLTSSEYAQRCGVVKSRVSKWVSTGMPYVEGKDDHGRDCKFIEPGIADRWRETYLTPRIDGQTGQLRGVVEQNLPANGAVSHEAAPSSAGYSPSSPKRPPAGGPGRVIAAGGPAEDSVRDRSTMRIQRAKVSQAEEAALIVRFRRMKEQGKLLDRKAFFEIFESFVGQVATTIDRMPADVATTVANRLGVTEHQAYMALRELVSDRLRTDLATYAAAQRDRFDLDEQPPPEDPEDARFLDEAEGEAG